MNRRTRKKKSGFLTFCFSFLPGAGEMYLGFMRMGVSLMGLFFALIALAAVLDLPALLFVLVVVWFYSFFHVHNLAGMSDDEFFNTEDEFLFNLDAFFHMDNKNVEKYRKAVAVILVAVGVLLLWDGIKDLFFAYLPEEVWWFISRIENRILKILVGVVIIAGGVRMIKGKEEELKEVTIDVDSIMPGGDSGTSGGYGAGNGSIYGSGFGQKAYGERSGDMADAFSYGAGAAEGRDGSTADIAGRKENAAAAGSRDGSMADVVLQGGCEGNRSTADGGYGRGMAADVIYGVDTRAGEVQERSGYGEVQDN